MKIIINLLWFHVSNHAIKQTVRITPFLLTGKSYGISLYVYQEEGPVLNMKWTSEMNRIS